MKFLLLYGTTEGQTRKIMRFVADRLVDQGHSVELVRADPGDDPGAGRFDGVIAAGSVHVGRYQQELIDLLKAQKAAFETRPSLFLSVSLAAAGDDKDDWAALDKIVTTFSEEIGWTPKKVVHVAGAFRFSEYDFFRSWAMRWIAHQKDETVTSDKDTEYTDWAALGAEVDAWVGGLS